MPDITITCPDGAFSAYLASPAGNSGGGVLVIQEIFGVNKDMRDHCDHLASQGYFALCPDIFWRQEPGIQITDQTDEEWAKAFELYQGFDVEKGVADPERICIIGASYGGYAALMEAARNSDLFRCAVSFAGVADLPYLLSTMRKYYNDEYLEKYWGEGDKDLESRSPLHLADGVEIPVLLVHGSEDRRVRVQHVGLNQQQGEDAHLFAPNGFLDDNWWHRAFWVYGRSVQGGPGYGQTGHSAPSGKIMVVDHENLYTVLSSSQGGNKAASAGADDKDVYLDIPG